MKVFYVVALLLPFSCGLDDIESTLVAREIMSMDKN